MRVFFFGGDEVSWLGFEGADLVRVLDGECWMRLEVSKFEARAKDLGRKWLWVTGVSLSSSNRTVTLFSNQNQLTVPVPALLWIGTGIRCYSCG